MLSALQGRYGFADKEQRCEPIEMKLKDSEREAFDVFSHKLFCP